MNPNHNKIFLKKLMAMTTRKYLNKFKNWKKPASRKGGKTSSKANAKGERAREITTKAKAISAEEIRQRKVKLEKSSANGAYTNPIATLGIKWPIGWIWCHSMPRGKETHNPLRNNKEGSRRGTKKQPVTASDMKPEKEETYVMNNPKGHGRRQHRGRTRGLQGTKPQQNIENDMKPDKEETIPGRPQRDPRRRGGIQQPHNTEEATAATKQIQQRGRNRMPDRFQPEGELHGGEEKIYKNCTTGTGSSTTSPTAGEDTPLH